MLGGAPNSKSWFAPCLSDAQELRHEWQQVKEEAACTGGAEREAQAPSCSPVSIADKSQPSFLPTHFPAPLLSCWTSATSHHLALGTAPFASWLHCFQMGIQGQWGYPLLPGQSHPSQKFPEPSPCQGCLLQAGSSPGPGALVGQNLAARSLCVVWDPSRCSERAGRCPGGRLGSRASHTWLPPLGQLAKIPALELRNLPLSPSLAFRLLDFQSERMLRAMYQQILKTNVSCQHFAHIILIIPPNNKDLRILRVIFILTDEA